MKLKNLKKNIFEHYHKIILLNLNFEKSIVSFSRNISVNCILEIIVAITSMTCSRPVTWMDPLVVVAAAFSPVY